MDLRKQYSDIIENVIDIQKKCSMDFSQNENLLKALSELPILVPVVGEFSSGKSTLLNNFIGKNILSTNINPETAIPTELYFSEKEYMEGVTEDGKAEIIESDENVSGKYINLRRYINSENLKKIEPITLVDMPGFDSPLDAHNRAIFNYLDRGSHYIIITPSTAGTISRSMVQQIENIKSFGKDCSFIVSKTDLRSDEDVKNVVDYLEDEIKSVFGETKKIITVNADDISLFTHIIEILDIDDLVSKMFKDSVSDSCYDLRVSLNTKISAFNKDQDKIKSGLRDLEKCLSNIEQTKERVIKEASDDTYTNEVEIIVNKIGNELNSNIEYLTDSAVNQSPEVLQDGIQEIIQTVLVNNMNDVMIQMSDRINCKFQMQLKDFDDVLKEFDCDSLNQKFSNVAKDLFNNGKQKIGNYIAMRKNNLTNKDFDNDDLRKKYQAVTSVLAIATDVINPILEIIIVFLPSILDGIFKIINEKKQREYIRKSIQSQIPKIKREVRTKLIELFQENSAQLITQISNKYDEEIRIKREEIEKVSETLENNANVENEKSMLIDQLNIVNDLLSGFLNRG